MLSKRHNTTAFNVRMDVRDFAAIVHAYRSKVPPSTAMSSYIRYALEDYVKALIAGGATREFETTEEANEYITDAGLRQQTKAVRAARDLIVELAGGKDTAAALAAAPTDHKRTPPKKMSADEILEILENEVRGEERDSDVQ